MECDGIRENAVSWLPSPGFRCAASGLPKKTLVYGRQRIRKYSSQGGLRVVLHMCEVSRSHAERGNERSNLALMYSGLRSTWEFILRELNKHKFFSARQCWIVAGASLRGAIWFNIPQHIAHQRNISRPIGTLLRGTLSTIDTKL
jgi:hypothetical protein